MPGTLDVWNSLHDRARALPPERRSLFALGCAEHLVAVEASAREVDLRQLLNSAWSLDPPTFPALTSAISQLNGREDLDDDEVAAVFYALRAVVGGGDAEAMVWVARRGMDAAYERIAFYRQDGLAQFRPLEVDDQEPVVQAEFSWQTHAVSVLENTTPLEQAALLLRS